MNIIFLHGLESSGQGFKGKLFQKQLPGILTPNFGGSLQQRMEQLYPLLMKKESWVIIGSSFGGLMGALYTCQFSEKVNKLILLAPLLAVPELNPNQFTPVNTPVIVFHGKNDNVVPFNTTMTRARLLFNNLTYNIVDDDHFLHSTVKKIKWKKLVAFSS